MRNYQELLVEEQLEKLAPNYPELTARPELRQDVACIALNHLKPRYFRRVTELERFMSKEERGENSVAVQAAVLSAIEYVILNSDDLLAGREGTGALDL
jgi:competence protein ComFB